MEEEQVQAIRETSRNVLFINRKKQKDEETDMRRSLGNLRISQSDVTAIANKLKTKSSITAAELQILQNSIVDYPQNIDVVLNTHGALRGLVRELTGHDVSKQCAACGCLCNLALGDSKTCCTIAKAAGAYLEATLDTLSTQLAVCCAWTLGNVAGAGARACALLAAQGALAKLCHVLHGNRDQEVREAVVYALSHAAFVMKDELKPDHLHKIIQSLAKAEINIETSQLLFILSCHEHYTPDIIPAAYLQKIVEKLAETMAKHIHCQQETISSASTSNSEHLNSSKTKCCELEYLLRVLGNLNSGKVYSELVVYFLNNNLVGVIRKLLQIDNLGKTLLWLLGNILNCCGENVFFHQLTANS